MDMLSESRQTSCIGGFTSLTQEDSCRTTLLQEQGPGAGPHGSFSASNDFSKMLSHFKAVERIPEEEVKAQKEMPKLPKPRKKRSARKLFKDSDEDTSEGPFERPLARTRSRRNVKPKFDVVDLLEKDDADVAEHDAVMDEEQNITEDPALSQPPTHRRSPQNINLAMLEPEFATFRAFFQITDSMPQFRLLHIILQYVVVKNRYDHGMSAELAHLQQLEKDYAGASTEAKRRTVEINMIDLCFRVMGSIYNIKAFNRSLLLQTAFADLQQSQQQPQQ
jgi:hypothetical protein